MKTILTAVIALPTLLLACASDPNKDLRDARNDRDQHFAKDVHEQTQLNNEQKVEQSELDKKHADEKAEARSTTMNDLAKDTATVDSKKADVSKERMIVTTEARERLSKIDSRAQDLRVKDKVRTSTGPMWTSFEKDRKETQTRFESLSAKTSDELASAKADVATRMDALEKTLDGIASKVK